MSFNHDVHTVTIAGQQLDLACEAGASINMSFHKERLAQVTLLYCGANGLVNFF